MPVALYQQPMEELELRRRYRTIIVASGSFGLLTDPGQASAAARRFFSHLEEGGRLVMSLIMYDPEDEQGEWALEGEREGPDGSMVRCWNR